MHRFYCPQNDFSSPAITITNSAELHHLRNVLRLKKGDSLNIFNGKGEEISGRIEKITDASAEIAVLSRQKALMQGIRITMACAIPKKAKFEYIIEKATELGVDTIIPMQTARTEVIVKGERKERKNVRYQAVAVNAAKQSGRRVLPEVLPVTLLKDIIAQAGDDTLKLIPCLVGERKSLAKVLGENKKERILFLIGPEGDFTPQEVQAALQSGFIPVSLGDTTLKVDTAAIAVMAGCRLIVHS